MQVYCLAIRINLGQLKLGWNENGKGRHRLLRYNALGGLSTPQTKIPRNPGEQLEQLHLSFRAS